MNIVFILFAFISSVCVKDVIGYDECMNKFKTCIQNRNCESRIKSLDFYCCKHGFLDGVFNQTKEDDCQDERMLSDAEDCLDELEANGCKFKIISYFIQNMDTFDKIEKELKEAVGEPSTKGECHDRVKRIEKEECLMCADKRDDDKIYGWLCDIIRNTRKSLYCTSEKQCMKLFNQCVGSHFTEKRINEIDVHCCKEVVNKSGDFFKNKDECAAKTVMKPIMECMFENEYCQTQTIKYFRKNEDLIEKFREHIERLIGAPKYSSECQKTYERSKMIALEECELNVDENIAPYCDLIRDLLHDKEFLNYIPDKMENHLKK